MIAAKGHQLSIGIGITYLLSKLHIVWFKTGLALIFKILPYSVPLFTHSAMWKVNNNLITTLDKILSFELFFFKNYTYLYDEEYVSITLPSQVAYSCYHICLAQKNKKKPLNRSQGFSKRVNPPSREKG